MPRNEDGRLDFEISFEGVVTKYVYDAAAGAGGRLVQRLYFASLDAYTTTPSLPTEIVAYAYDAFGREADVVQDEDGDLTSTADQRVAENIYDPSGDLVTVISPEGVIHYEYDAVTGLHTRTWTASDTTTIDANATTDTHYAYDSLGRLDSVTMDRRNASPVDIDANTLGDQPETTDYVYDLLGNLDQVRLSNGVVSDYDYDNLNRLELLTEFTDGENSQQKDVYEFGVDTLLAQYDYDLAADGKRSGVTEKTLVDGVLQQTRIDWLYDDIGRLTREVYDGYGADMDFATDYVLDLVGNRCAKNTDKTPTAAYRTGEPMMPANIDEAITSTFDANDRLLTEAKDDRTDVNQDRFTVYRYDADGDGIDEATQQTDKIVYRGLNSGGILAEQTTYSYDIQGRMSESVTKEYATDGTTLLSTDTTTYKYDAEGIRISQTEDGVEIKYLNDKQNPTGYSQVLEEKDASGVVKKTYSLGLDVIAQQSSAIYNGPAFLLYDGHGSTRSLVDATGQIINSNGAAQVFRYDAFGNRLDSVAALTTLLYSGEQTDPTGLQYLRARYYNLNTGRFNSLDPFAGNTNDPQSLHLYLYCYDDGVNLGDPSGNYPSVISWMARWLLGTFVHSFIANAYESAGTAHVNRWGNRWISTIAADLNAPLSFPLPLRPDMAGIKEGGGVGEVYELKPGDIMTYYSKSAFVAEGSNGLLQAVLYRSALNLAVPKVRWNLGRTCWDGIKEWKAFRMVPGWTLVTFADYNSLPGVLLYDFVPNKMAYTMEILADAASIAIYLNYVGAFSQIYSGIGRAIGAVTAEDSVRGSFGRGAAYLGLFAGVAAVEDIGMDF